LPCLLRGACDREHRAALRRPERTGRCWSSGPGFCGPGLFAPVCRNAGSPIGRGLQRAACHVRSPRGSASRACFPDHPPDRPRVQKAVAPAAVRVDHLRVIVSQPSPSRSTPTKLPNISASSGWASTPTGCAALPPKARSYALLMNSSDNTPPLSISTPPTIFEKTRLVCFTISRVPRGRTRLDWRSHTCDIVTVSSAPPRTLFQGSVGSDVTRAQQLLNKAQPTALPLLGVDGIYGLKTTARAREF
jgi:hypothetical protein